MLRSKPLAVALIVLTFLGTTGSWHPEGDDPDFLAPSLGHNHGAHHEALRTAATPEDAAPAHCAICHWLQSFRASSVRHPRVQPVQSSPQPHALATLVAVRSGIALSVPSRAPPA